MAYWLLKTEPSSFSYRDLEREKKSRWDGVSNNQALIHLRAMKEGDLALIYHSGAEKKIVGMAEIVRGPYSDPRLRDPKFVVVDLVPRGSLPAGPSLAQIRAVKEFYSFALVRNSRLSVMPVTAAQWKMLIAMFH
jgi:predicted RNA-binding protein with PUA-like domain